MTGFEPRISVLPTVSQPLPNTYTLFEKIGRLLDSNWDPLYSQNVSDVEIYKIIFILPITSIPRRRNLNPRPTDIEANLLPLRHDSFNLHTRLTFRKCDVTQHLKFCWSEVFFSLMHLHSSFDLTGHQHDHFCNSTWRSIASMSCNMKGHFRYLFRTKTCKCLFLVSDSV